jgi:hypothetical protein
MYQGKGDGADLPLRFAGGPTGAGLGIGRQQGMSTSEHHEQPLVIIFFG